jgi:hypothetical protein
MSALSLQIATAGLEHWCAGTGVHAQEFIASVLVVQDDPKAEREFARSAPFGITDPRWVETICRTCSFALPRETGSALDFEGMEAVFQFTQINAYACRCGHENIDQFTALTSDPIWKVLRPPFDWLCGCTVLHLMDIDVSQPTEAVIPAAERFNADLFEKIKTWMQHSPEMAFKLL